MKDLVIALASTAYFAGILLNARAWFMHARKKAFTPSLGKPPRVGGQCSRCNMQYRPNCTCASNYTYVGMSSSDKAAEAVFCFIVSWAWPLMLAGYGMFWCITTHPVKSAYEMKTEREMTQKVINEKEKSLGLPLTSWEN